MPSLVFSPLTTSNISAVLSLVGPVVDALYPDGRCLFQNRLGDVLDQRARCTVAFARNRIVGVAVETPKGTRRLKLSTFWVHPLWRRRYVGTALIKQLSDSWLKYEMESIHLTVSLREHSGVFGLLRNFGFQHLCVVPNRYGEGRDEAVLIWKPDLHPAIAGNPSTHAPISVATVTLVGERIAA